MGKNIFADFFNGIHSVIKGSISFYKDPAAWKYALYPILLLVFFYAAALWLWITAIGFCFNWCKNFADSLPEYLAWSENIVTFLLIAAGVILAAFAIITTLSSLYEIAGGFFFDHLAAFWEKKYFNFQKHDESWKESAVFLWDSVIFGLGTIWYLLLLSIIGIFLPVIGPIILTIVMSYRFGISALSCTAFTHGMRIKELRNIPGTFCFFLGFGLAAYFLILLPVVGIFMLPGIIVGGVELLHNISDNRSI